MPSIVPSKDPSVKHPFDSVALQQRSIRLTASLFNGAAFV
jgi:hypothetical protein